MKRFGIAVLACALVVGLWCSLQTPITVEAQGSPAWPQWAQSPQHTGFLNVAGQSLNRNLVNIVYDPLVPQEMAGNSGRAFVAFQNASGAGQKHNVETKNG